MDNLTILGNNTKIEQSFCINSRMVAGYRRMGVWLRRFEGGDSIHGGRPIRCDGSRAPPRIFPFLRRLRLQPERDQPLRRYPHPQSRVRQNIGQVKDDNHIADSRTKL